MYTLDRHLICVLTTGSKKPMDLQAYVLPVWALMAENLQAEALLSLNGSQKAPRWLQNTQMVLISAPNGPKWRPQGSRGGPGAPPGHCLGGARGRQNEGRPPSELPRRRTKLMHRRWVLVQNGQL